MKPKEYLVKEGHIKVAGRGRLSREQIAIIEAAVSNGVAIEGYSVSTPATASEPAEVKRAVSAVDVFDVPDEKRPERDWEAVRVNDQTTIGMRTVCNTCKNSLNYCLCQFPMVWVGHNHQSEVTFVPRKTPMKRPY